MPRRPKGWTPEQFFDKREIHRRRPLAMTAQPLSNAHIAGLAQQTDTSDGDVQLMSGPSAPRRSHQNTGPSRGTSFVRDSNGTFQAVQALMARRAVVPGIMESFLHRLGLELQTIDTGARVVRKQTPMGPLELVGTAGLVLRLRNQTSSRRITVQVWRGEEGNRYDLYFDPANGALFLEHEGTSTPSSLTMIRMCTNIDLRQPQRSTAQRSCHTDGHHCQRPAPEIAS